VTKPEHRPQSHRAWGEWPPERIVGWAQTKGAKTGEVAAAILERGPHPESGRRACLGLVRMGEKYGDERLEAACARALAIGNPTLQSVKAILKNGLEKVALVEEVETKSVVHENIRGGDYFDREEVSPTSDQDKIEARYLEDERLAIIHEQSADSSREKIRDGHAVKVRSVTSSRGGVNPAGPGLGAAVRAETLPMMLKRLHHTGSTLRSRSNPDKAAIARAIEAKVWPLIAAGKVRPVMDQTFALADAAAAHARMESSQHIGKIVLTV
jgi:hypothetical protein